MMVPLQTALDVWPRPVMDGSTLVVRTHCLYPSRDVVVAYVEGGEETAVVSDGGGAFDQVDARIDYKSDPFKSVRKQMAASWDLRIDDKGWIHSQPISHQHVASMISIVANASRQAAELLLAHLRPKRSDFRTQLHRFIHSRFGSSVVDKPKARLIGASNKSHVLDYLIDLGGDRRLALDAVTPDPSSINAAIVAHMDIKHADIPNLEQRIVYDDADDWRSSDIALLAVGSRPVQFSRIEPVLERLAHA